MAFTPIETAYKPDGALGALFAGFNAADAQAYNEEDLLKQYLSNYKTQNTVNDEIMKSNLAGKLDQLRYNDPNYANLQVAGENADAQMKGYNRDITRDTLQGKINFTNRKYQSDTLDLDKGDLLSNAQIAAIKGLPPEGTGQVGFSFQPQKPQQSVAPKSMFATRDWLESRGKDYTADGKPMTSSKGALFKNQVMPSTAKDPGFGIRPAASQTPEEYNRVGDELLQKLYEKYGNEEMALAAYNAGHGTVDRAIEKAKATGQDWRSFLPEETKQYIAKSGFSGTGNEARPQNVLSNFSKDTPWSNIMNPNSRVGQIAAILGMDPKYAARQSELETQNAGKVAAAEARAGNAEATLRAGIDKAQLSQAMTGYTNAENQISKLMAEKGKLNKAELEQLIIEKIFNGKKPSQGDIDRVAKQYLAEFDTKIAQLEEQKAQFAKFGNFPHIPTGSSTLNKSNVINLDNLPPKPKS